MDLSVITVNWNVKELVSRLIDSIFQYTDGLNFEVIVVDNDSRDGSVDFLRQNHKDWIDNGKLKIIANNFNAGFAKANNQGLKIAQGKYLLFMNPDMELTENSFLKLKEFMDQTPNVGIATCRLLYGDKTVQANVKSNPRLCDQALVLLKLHHFLSWLPRLKRYLRKDFDYSQNQYVEQVKEIAAIEGAKVVIVSAAVEAEVAELPKEERGEFLQGLGLKESGLQQVVREGMDLLGLITFFTAGPKEVHAWTLRKS